MLTSRVVAYEPINVFRSGKYYYAEDLDFREMMLPIRSGFRPSPPFFATSTMEKQWVIDTYLKMF